MRDIVVAEGEFWRIPDAHVQVPAYDLFVEHWKISEEDGAAATLVVSGVTYKSVFYDGVARFYIGESLKFNANANITYFMTIGGDEYSFTVWFGIDKNSGKLPEVLFSENNFLSIIPDLTTPLSLCINAGGSTTEYEDTVGVEIPALSGSFATAWLGAPETIPEDAKIIRVLPVCDDAHKVLFILQTGEQRTWFLREKRKVAEFREITRYNKVELSGDNESTYEISDGENEITTTLFTDGLRKNELDEISQLAVSRYVVIDGVRAEIIRKSAVISGNSRGGLFTIDVKGSL